MRLTSFTDFGLRALILLAGTRDELITAATIADGLGVSRHHMAKVLHQLAAHNFVDSLRGPQGGVRLARDPREIKVGDVVRALEGKEDMVDCGAGRAEACRLLPGCRLPGMLRQAEASFLKELDRFTLADCVRRPGNAASLI